MAREEEVPVRTAVRESLVAADPLHSSSVIHGAGDEGDDAEGSASSPPDAAMGRGGEVVFVRS